MPIPEKDEEFTEQTFRDLATVFPGGGQISQEMLNLYSDLGKTICDSSSVTAVIDKHIRIQNEIMIGSRFTIGGSDAPEYQKASRRKASLARKKEQLLKMLAQRRVTGTYIRHMAQLLSKRTPKLNYATFKALVKKNKGKK